MDLVGEMKALRVFAARFVNEKVFQEGVAVRVFQFDSTMVLCCLY